MAGGAGKGEGGVLARPSFRVGYAVSAAARISLGSRDRVYRAYNIEASFAQPPHRQSFANNDSDNDLMINRESLGL